MKGMKMIKIMRRWNFVNSAGAVGVILTLACASLWTPSVRGAAAPLKVVTTTEDLGSLAREIGGDRITVDVFSRGYQDPHFVEPKPSFILKLVNADLLIVVGRELEIGWLPALLTQSRNARIQPGARGHLDASMNVRILEVPTGQITRAMGDVHPTGNPHYWLDPDNGRRIAQAIRDRLGELLPGDQAYFAQRYADFDSRLTQAQKRWDSLMAPYKGTKIVTYHRSWPNFTERFGLTVVGYVEPKPGIPPSPGHTVALIAEMKRQGIKIILVEPYFDVKTPQAVARQTGAEVLVMPPSVGGVKEATDYIALFEYNVNLLTAAFKRVGT
jgi:ABC-type Zn uptake system ZnuABC Zn-binding protein ZnuA